MKAAFRTEGNTTTQSALSSKSCGTLSGTSRISFKTDPQFFNRSSSLVWSDAFATWERNGVTTNGMLLRQLENFRMWYSSVSFCCLRSGDCSPPATSKIRADVWEVIEKRALKGKGEIGVLECRTADGQQTGRLSTRRQSVLRRKTR